MLSITQRRSKLRSGPPKLRCMTECDVPEIRKRDRKQEKPSSPSAGWDSWRKGRLNALTTRCGAMQTSPEVPHRSWLLDSASSTLVQPQRCLLCPKSDEGEQYRSNTRCPQHCMRGVVSGSPCAAPIFQVGAGRKLIPPPVSPMKKRPLSRQSWGWRVLVNKGRNLMHVSCSRSCKPRVCRKYSNENTTAPEVTVRPNTPKAMLAGQELVRKRAVR